MANVRDNDDLPEYSRHGTIPILTPSTIAGQLDLVENLAAALRTHPSSSTQSHTQAIALPSPASHDANMGPPSRPWEPSGTLNSRTDPVHLSQSRRWYGFDETSERLASSDGLEGFRYPHQQIGRGEIRPSTISATAGPPMPASSSLFNDSHGSFDEAQSSIPNSRDPLPRLSLAIPGVSEIMQNMPPPSGQDSPLSPPLFLEDPSSESEEEDDTTTLPCSPVSQNNDDPIGHFTAPRRTRSPPSVTGVLRGRSPLSAHPRADYYAYFAGGNHGRPTPYSSWDAPTEPASPTIYPTPTRAYEPGFAHRTALRRLNIGRAHDPNPEQTQPPRRLVEYLAPFPAPTHEHLLIPAHEARLGDILDLDPLPYRVHRITKIQSRHNTQNPAIGYLRNRRWGGPPAVSTIDTETFTFSGPDPSLGYGTLRSGTPAKVVWQEHYTGDERMRVWREIPQWREWVADVGLGVAGNGVRDRTAGLTREEAERFWRIEVQVESGESSAVRAERRRRMDEEWMGLLGALVRPERRVDNGFVRGMDQKLEEKSATGNAYDGRDEAVLDETDSSDMG